MPYKINCKKKIDENLLTVINLLNQNKIKYWLCHGSLLGLMRDKQLLDWDHDIDIGILHNTFLIRIIKTLMRQHGFKIINKSNDKHDSTIKFIRPGGKEIDFNLYKIRGKKIAIVWPYPGKIFCKIIDAFALEKKYKGKFKIIPIISKYLAFLFKFIKKIMVKKELFFSYAGYCHDEKYIKHLDYVKLNYCKISIPNHYQNYLVDLYGKKWKRKIKTFNWVNDSPSTIKYESSKKF